MKVICKNESEGLFTKGREYKFHKNGDGSVAINSDIGFYFISELELENDFYEIEDLEPIGKSY